jgi:hypothetical protein
MHEHTITQTALRRFYNGWKQFDITNTRATEHCSGSPKNILGLSTPPSAFKIGVEN